MPSDPLPSADDVCGILKGHEQHRPAEELDAELVTERKRRERLEEALREALDLADEGWAYASEYFHEKWDYGTRRDALAEALAQEDSP